MRAGGEFEGGTLIVQTKPAGHDLIHWRVVDEQSGTRLASGFAADQAEVDRLAKRQIELVTGAARGLATLTRVDLTKAGRG